MLGPVSDFEADQYRQHGLAPVQVEANTPEEIIPHVKDCDALFVVSTALRAPVIESLARCRVISRMGMGTDKIDIETATARGILVTNVPTFCVEEQADHTMALLLSLARQIPFMSRAMHAGTFHAAHLATRNNRRLSTVTLGLVGFGGSAKATARRAAGFGMKVLATRLHMRPADPEAEALGVQMVDLDTLLAQSDYVSLHLPLTKQSYHLFDDATLRKMKPGAYLINTSRGAIVDETALVAALREGRLGGAGIDTYEGINIFDPNEAPPVHPLVLLEMDNVVLTPHVAAGSLQAGQDVGRGAVENVAAVLNGRWPPLENIVNPEVVPRFPLVR
ncbi:MAG: C-terminal binding protein [Chloroflexi bacterium]|nr:C-terminal binding protein [Chloroflexota bacterium]